MSGVTFGSNIVPLFATAPLDWAVIAGASIVQQLFGYFWYGSKMFGDHVHIAHLKERRSTTPHTNQAHVLTFLGCLITNFFIYHMLQAINPLTTWECIAVGTFVWLLPLALQFMHGVWEAATLKRLAIDEGFHALVFLGNSLLLNAIRQRLVHVTATSFKAG